MKKFTPVLGFLFFGIFSSGCVDNMPTEASQDQTAAEAALATDPISSGKAPEKCDPWPECRPDDTTGDWTEYSVRVVPAGENDEFDLESYCPGYTDIKLSGMWFKSDCNPSDSPNTPFDYQPIGYSADENFFQGNGSIFIDVKKKTYRFWLWPGNNHTKAYDSGTQRYDDGNLTTNDQGVVRLKIRAEHEMCQNKKRFVDCVGNVKFGDVVYTPIQ
jgi:hypothetical protein